MSDSNNQPPNSDEILSPGSGRGGDNMMGRPIQKPRKNIPVDNNAPTIREINKVEEEQYNEKLVRAIICILLADGKIDEQEKHFLYMVCNKFNIPDKQVEAFIIQEKKGNRSINFPMEEEKRIDFLSWLVKAAAANDEIHPSEQKSLALLAKNMKIDSSILQSLIDESIMNRKIKGFNYKNNKNFAIKNFIKKPGILFLLLIITIPSVIAGGFISNSISWVSTLDAFLSDNNENTVIISPASFKSTDKLFTAFAYMAILDKKYDQNTISGYCFRQYEVGIGYKNTVDIFTDEQYHYPKLACEGASEQLPEPQILSSNVVDSDAKGEYEMIKCNAMDTGNRKQPGKSHTLLKASLIRSNTWEPIAEKSRKMLMGYMQIYCK
ncbi:TerB family tellurite resistance protein [Candidatus Venteria ishoeyi]|uniref:tellurite resistance TerB family protein n=1 Tax=Candidatus Venteria ishoeyi TaxID=1899563 RepID=UPI0025A5A84E|nr:TerB family tellurite resistance protein [Candidatus Venteria ishoeyi]MDM8545585.1 TerB family tellurite resistance protein [Candidatus Venteria ishoeyi]